MMDIDCVLCAQAKILGSSCSDLATARTMDVFPDPERPVTRTPETNQGLLSHGIIQFRVNPYTHIREQNSSLNAKEIL